MAIEIYFEQTPNPESLKFVTAKMLLPNLFVEVKRGNDPKDSPLAEDLLRKFEWISGVFIQNTFITISKNTDTEWYELMHDIKAFLQMYLEHSLNIVTKEFLDKQLTAKVNESHDISTEGKIKNLLEKYVQPAVEKDGGSISFYSFHDGIVKLKMQGSCSGCPSSQITLKSGIEGLLKRMIPEVMSVEAEAG